jgi:hypothetical protein
VDIFVLIVVGIIGGFILGIIVAAIALGRED